VAGELPAGAGLENRTMRLNKSTSHAIRILLDCAKAGDGLVKAAEVSARLDITMQNTLKMVNVLAHAGLITAVRGRNGGIKLSRPADEIRIGDIVRALEATDLELEMAGAKRRSAAQVAGVNRVLDSAFEAFISVLDQHTLADMAGGEAGGEALKPSADRRAKPRTQSAPIRIPVVRARAAAGSASRTVRK
jgi:Rrf2 family nitric oxide-sensitive transcriptional repressor